MCSSLSINATPSSVCAVFFGVGVFEKEVFLRRVEEEPPRF
jgi:hypothetical protein